MNLSLTVLYGWPLDAAVDAALKGILSEWHGASARPEQLAHTPRWDAAEVKRLLEHPPAPELDGPVILLITIKDIQGLTLMRVRHRIEAILVAAMSTLWRVNILGRMLGRTEWDIRRMQKRAISLGLLVKDEFGHLQQVRPPKTEQ